MEEEMEFESIEDYQNYLKQRQELLAYCKKINQGIENLDEKSGERAIWELVQNARDMDENSRIRIELKPDKIVFSHHGSRSTIHPSWLWLTRIAAKTTLGQTL